MGIKSGFAPPLTITKTQIDECIGMIGDGLRILNSRPNIVYLGYVNFLNEQPGKGSVACKAS